MDCPRQVQTSAFIDGELDEHASREAERHIAGCADCQAFVAAAADVSERLRAPGVRVAAPAVLRSAVQRGLAVEPAAGGAGKRRRRWAPGGFVWGAFSGIGASAMAAGVALLLLAPPSAASFANAITDAHVHALMDGRVMQVVSTSHHTVKPWFAGRTPFSPPVVDFAAQGFALAGGRVDTVQGERTAVIAYRHGAHEIDLYVWPAADRAQPAGGDRLGYHLLAWRSGDLAFAAVSDVAPDELKRFAGLVRSERE